MTNRDRLERTNGHGARRDRPEDPLGRSTRLEPMRHDARMEGFAPTGGPTFRECGDAATVTKPDYAIDRGSSPTIVDVREVHLKTSRGIKQR
ncbi:hypothetical protein CC1G_14195 [Coprinopsis cinerea okayama7|uniref:Uncharacterized protein n=1 Tax=Coprinopsis cinerea (strain Okayama-7 / 130 / ATCC MYA-4618 / FGSC 9003) TaxID=240176 RepID=D6RLM4_COPC7|nr:hypothetical protein CC1G_14195 [Coprinopsis cinerea okayama7\|eukprot:XP_002911662.1 hypothetical protein CC1G_14195 [Coprinopsis cinerea okayama7\